MARIYTHLIMHKDEALSYWFGLCEGILQNGMLIHEVNT
jgi:hypothetical protein